MFLILLIGSSLLLNGCHPNNEPNKPPPGGNDSTYHPTKGVTIHPYLTIDGKKKSSDILQFQKTDSMITVSFKAPHDGTYQYGFALMSKVVTPIAFLPTKTIKGLPHITAGSIPYDVLHYPYDWTYRGSGNVIVQAKLISPAVKAGDKVFLDNVFELTTFQFESTDDGKVRVLLLDNRFYNDGSDAATPKWHLKKGDKKSFSIRIFDNMKEVYNYRFSPPKPTSGGGLLTNIYYRGWSKNRLGKEKYKEAADRFKGVYDQVMIREGGYDDYGWIPSIFHEQGLKVVDYEFINGLRRDSPQQRAAVQWISGHGYDVPSLDGVPLGMPDSKGELLTNRQGGQMIVNIRKPGIRKFFVQQARKAIEMGFDGVFYDSYPFWRDSGGRVGTGDLPDAKFSMFHAMCLLLKEVRAAMREVNPNAKLGVLANRYIDFYSTADFAMKERMYNGFIKHKHGIGSRATWVSQDNDVFYEKYRAPFIPTNIMYGFKGVDPVSVQSAKHFLRDKRGGLYMTSGDFYIKDFDAFLDRQVKIEKENALYITQMNPGSARVNFDVKKKDGKSVITCDQNVNITFSIPVWISHNGTLNNSKTKKLSMSSGEEYIIYNPKIIPHPNE